ncbi:MAG: thiamine pyrophosphate-dependent enzyme [Bacteroidales bacterium]|jgi:indolepyruvate ferredoxin oxidoreductase alpha subunit|nr:thiamine pyrophosphate-dependent enzyme [Bacteroidales bacterium]
MEKLLLLGDEAIAQSAIDAGLSGIYAYPGTPSTEILEYVHRSKEAKEKKIQASWSVNEKTAMEAALGMSYAGKRTMVCMKHVGLNVAADAFINSAITGANGGLIVVAADDPSMHSSQNEQDSRFYGKFAMIPVLEPTNQQEAYDMVRAGFLLSEKYGIPVLLRITTRLAHSRSGIIRREPLPQNEVHLPGNPKQFILLPANARRQYKSLLRNQVLFEEESENSVFNQYREGTDKSLGVITCGIAYNYLFENFQDSEFPYPLLKIGQYPVPRKMIEKLYSECNTILILEEGYPILEELLRGLLDDGKKIKGRMDGTVPRDGELNPNIVARAFGLDEDYGFDVPELVKSRPPSLCKGCPHIYSYNALNEALNLYSKGRVFSDIGCYTLGALEPYGAINTCVDMGASITMAKGAADAGYVPAVAVIGDSTFTHSGMTGLLDAINDKSPITVMILDNATTAMTGGQKSSATGRLEDICLGLGVEKEHIHILNPSPKNHEENLKIIEQEINYPGVSVIIPRRECIQTVARRLRDEKKEKQKQEVIE